MRGSDVHKEKRALLPAAAPTEASYVCTLNRLARAALLPDLRGALTHGPGVAISRATAGPLLHGIHLLAA